MPNRTLAGWLRGAGDGRADSGLSLERSLNGDPIDSVPEQHERGLGRPHRAREQDTTCEAESSFREIFYSHVGGFDQQHVTQDVNWLRRLGSCTELDTEHVNLHGLKDHNTFFQLSTSSAKKLVPKITEAVVSSGPCTRVRFESDDTTPGKA